MTPAAPEVLVSDKAIRTPSKTEVTTVLGSIDNFNPVRNAVDPQAYDEYRRMWDATSKLELETDFPLQLDFELNYSCNFSCPMCTWNAETTSRFGKDKWFPFEVWTELIDEAISKGLKSIRLNQINEPLIRGDIAKFVKYARDAGILDIYFSTNGSLLTEKVSRELIEAGLMRIQVSLDAATKETYDKIRIGGNYHKILQNIDRFLEIRDEMGSQLPTLRVNFVKTPENVHELDDFVKLWENKADFVGVQDLLGIVEAFDKSKKETYDADKEDFKCAQPFQHMTVRSNGHILPCCSFFGPDTPVAKLKHGVEGIEMIGEDGILVNEETQEKISKLMVMSIEEAWNCDEMRFIRAIHKVGEYWKHPVCKRCVQSTSHVDDTQ